MSCLRGYPWGFPPCQLVGDSILQTCSPLPAIRRFGQICLPGLVLSAATRHAFLGFPRHGVYKLACGPQTVKLGSLGAVFMALTLLMESGILGSLYRVLEKQVLLLIAHMSGDEAWARLYRTHSEELFIDEDPDVRDERQLLSNGTTHPPLQHCTVHLFFPLFHFTFFWGAARGGAGQLWGFELVWYMCPALYDKFPVWAATHDLCLHHACALACLASVHARQRKRGGAEGREGGRGRHGAMMVLITEKSVSCFVFYCKVGSNSISCASLWQMQALLGLGSVTQPGKP